LGKDQGNKGAVIVNENSELSIIYFHLIDLYEKFPDVFMIDGTYNVNKSHMPLYSFIGYGHGRTVFYAATESAQHLRAIVQAFKNFNPCYGNTKVIIIDKDFTEIAVLKDKFPTAKILFYQFPCDQVLSQSCVRCRSAQRTKGRLMESFT